MSCFHMRLSYGSDALNCSMSGSVSPLKRPLRLSRKPTDDTDDTPMPSLIARTSAAALRGAERRTVRSAQGAGASGARWTAESERSRRTVLCTEAIYTRTATVLFPEENGLVQVSEKRTFAGRHQDLNRTTKTV